ncbi:MAG: helix-turn-helix transcriptional regulator [Alphaproteobacteria bacterium]|nr:helix-turn-helix transcriptional regulator [Alphaproteobacteria bacterium]
MNDFLITPSLVKAARALLDWQQADLARASSVSLTAVRAYENNLRSPRPSTVQALQDTLEQKGIEFLVGGGLRLIDDMTSVIRFSGPDFTRKLNEDIYASVRDPQSEILTVSADEGMWRRVPHMRQANDEYLAWCEKTGMLLRHKMLIPEGDYTFNFPRQVYRALPHELVGKICYTLYADRLTLILWKRRQVIVLRNKAVVETFRNQFMYLWRLAKPV